MAALVAEQKSAEPGGVLLRFVLNGSGPSFADALRTERRASTVAVVGRLLLRLAKEERRGHHPDHC